jgi:hypothetical protein
LKANPRKKIIRTQESKERKFNKIENATYLKSKR